MICCVLSFSPERKCLIVGCCLFLVVCRLLHQQCSVGATTAIRGGMGGGDGAQVKWEAMYLYSLLTHFLPVPPFSCSHHLRHDDDDDDENKDRDENEDATDATTSQSRTGSCDMDGALSTE